jgi:hypothetical protein
MRQIADSENDALIRSRGLAAILRWEKAHPEPDDGDDGAYADCAGAPGLRGLLFYQSPQGAG